jgi:hypothetical protein
MNIQDLLPKDYQTHRKREILALTSKWRKTGLLEGLDGPDAGNMAQLLENQARQLVTEANRTGAETNSEEWAGIALPLVRRVFADISSKEFVSVQPMNLPSGLVFFLDFKYGTGQPGFNTAAGKNSQNDSLFGITDSNKGTTTNPYGDTTPWEGLYGPGRFGYTINDYSSSATTRGATLSTSNFTTGSVAATDYNFNSLFSGSIVAVGSRLKKITVSQSRFSNPDLKSVRAWTITNSTGTLVYDMYPEFTKYNTTAKTVTFIVSSSIGGATDALKFNYHKQPTDITRGDFEEGRTQSGAGTEALDIPEINLEFRSEEIVAKTRKLKAKWTPEFAQDINAYQNIDAEAELTSILGEYISQEIDLEILDMLIHDAQTIEYWDARLGFEFNGTNAFNQTSANAAAYNQGTWFQTLGTKMQKVSNRIHTKTLRGGANFCVVSPTVATILESIPGYAADTDGDKMKFAMGVQKVGSLNSRFQVYKNPYMTENCILMGFRGSQYLETGAVYAPYIPLMMTPLVLDPDNFTPRKGVMTRYAKKMLRPEFYGKIYVNSLNTL